MEPAAGKPALLRNAVIRVLLISVLVLLFRFVYVVTMRGESCDLGDFCFFALPENFTALAGTPWLDVTAVRSTEAIRSTSAAVPGPSGAHPNLWTTKSYRKAVQFYSSVFGDLISEGFLSPSSKSLCLDTPTGQDVFALKEAGVPDAVGIAGRASKPLLIKGQAHHQPFGDNSFDFVFSGAGAIDRSPRPGDFASEVGRTLRPEGFAVVHTASRDSYSFNSLVDLFNCCILIRSRDMDGFDSSMPVIREIVMKKQVDFRFLGYGYDDLQPQLPGDSDSECSVPGYKHELVRNAEGLIAREPSKPWITLKQNIKNIRYLPSMADISFKQRYIYIDVGARSYGSSIVSWFKKHYPKQNKTFEIYAIEADGTFHEQYRGRKGVTLLPYAAWVRNETLFFEINGVPGDENLERGRGMGRIRPVQAAAEGGSAAGDVDEIRGFDFAEWLKQTVRERDFVVMKMDVEGTEFDLIPKLVETGAICLIDELFLECHYNRWQRCCPGERSAKYQKTYGQCLDLFRSLRKRGVLVHQWW